MPNVFGELTFGELVDAVGASEYTVGQAILALRIQPKIYANDRRQRWYPFSAVEAIRSWIERQNSNIVFG